MEKQVENLRKAIAHGKLSVEALHKSQRGFDFAGQDPHHVAYERRNAAGTVSHIQAKGARKEKTQHAAPRVNPAEITRFSSGMTSITELKAGTSVLADSRKVGLGIDIGLLTAPAMQALANGIVNHRARVFIDSGAFSLFRKNLKNLQTSQQLSLLGANEAPDWKTMDFDKVLAKYDAVMDAIAEANSAEEQITLPYFVMPDIIGDQEGTTELYRKYRDRIRSEVQFNPNCIVPLQAGAKTLADAYREIVSILGVDTFIVGIPSQEEAVSNKEVTAFIKEVKPARVHFLGAISDLTLAPRIAAVNASGHIPDISADGNILRSKLYGQEVEGSNRREKVATVLRQEMDLSEVYSQYLGQKEPSTMPNKKLENLRKAIALGKLSVEVLQKSHVQAHTRTSASGAVSQVSAYDDKREAPPQADTNRHNWQHLPDDENPQFALSRIPSKELGKIAKGETDAQRKAKEELAARGVDEHGKWLGFDKAEAHHGVTTKHMGGDAADHDEVMGHFQVLHHKVLGAIAAGHTDPKRLAREELANRGHDENGKWVGFDAAAKHHAKHDAKTKPDPVAKLAELKQHEHGGPTFSQKILHHGKETGTGHEEIARMSSAIHASEAAHSKESHARAYFEHTAAEAEAKNPVYKQYHHETAAYHKKQAGLEE